MEPAGHLLQEVNQEVAAAAIRLKADSDQVIRFHECCAWGSVLIRKKRLASLDYNKKMLFFSEKRDF